MNEEERENVARAIYAAYATWHVNRWHSRQPAWEELDDLTCVMFRRMADTAYGAIMVLLEERKT
jgi:hypothetical protein